MTEKDLARFWSKVDKTSSPNGCWLWTAYKDARGYGVFGVNGKNRGAHRIAWELAKGPIPDGLFVCHNCPGGDNPTCCNPEHCFLGTASDNRNDYSKKWRAGGGVPKHPNEFSRIQFATTPELQAAIEAVRLPGESVGHAARRIAETALGMEPMPIKARKSIASD